MKAVITQRYKLDSDGDGIYYTTADNKDMFNSYDIELIVASDTKHIDELVKECDFLYVPGGIDVDPKYYREEVNGTKDHFDWLDELDFACIDAFHKACKPILGVCRGHQIINVFFGGSLYQDMPEHWGSWHEVELEKDSFINKIYDTDVLKVNSWHHQAVKDVAPGFRVVAMSKDGYVEALELGNIYTVQWHPEMYDGANFMKSFVEKILNK